MWKSVQYVVPLVLAPCVYSTCCLAHDREIVVGDAIRMNQQSFVASAKGMIADPQLIYGATGVVTCGGIRATGQLTVHGDEVTSAAHTFFDEAAGHWSSCFFYESLTPEKVREEIVSADASLKQLTGSDWTARKGSEMIQLCSVPNTTLCVNVSP